MLILNGNIKIEDLEQFGFQKLNDSYMKPYGYELKPENPEEDNNYSSEGFGIIEIDEFDVDGNIDRSVHLYTTTDDEVWWNIEVLYKLIKAGWIVLV